MLICEACKLKCRCYLQCGNLSPISTFQVQGGSLNIPNMVSSEGNVMATDSIGDLVVEAKSSAAAWRNFARLFVLKLQSSGIELQSLGSLRPHAIDVSTKSSIGSEPRISVEPVSSQNCLSAEVQAKDMECPQDIDLAEGSAVYRALQERLSVDRFGLKERYVQELIYGLLNGRQNEEKPEDPKSSIPLTRNLRHRDKRVQDESGGHSLSCLWLLVLMRMNVSSLLKHFLKSKYIWMSLMTRIYLIISFYVTRSEFICHLDGSTIIYSCGQCRCK